MRKMIKQLMSIIFVLGFGQFVYAQELHEIQKYDELLKQYVKEVTIDFSGLCKDTRLNDFISVLKNTEPPSVENKSARLAYWINAYNAYTLKVICDKYPIKSMGQFSFGGIVVAAITKKTIWDRPLVILGGKKYTLKDLDHSIIRGENSDPRLQFAMYCGSVSCPMLRTEAFKADQLETQLTEQTRSFFNNSRWNRFDVNNKSATISPLMDWNAKYFGKTKEEVLRFIGTYVDSDAGKLLRDDPLSWKIKYGEYQLTINDEKN